MKGTEATEPSEAGASLMMAASAASLPPFFWGNIEIETPLFATHECDNACQARCQKSHLHVARYLLSTLSSFLVPTLLFALIACHMLK